MLLSSWLIHEQLTLFQVMCRGHISAGLLPSQKPSVPANQTKKGRSASRFARTGYFVNSEFGVISLEKTRKITQIGAICESGGPCEFCELFSRKTPLFANRFANQPLLGLPERLPNLSPPNLELSARVQESFPEQLLNHCCKSRAGRTQGFQGGGVPDLPRPS